MAWKQSGSFFDPDRILLRKRMNWESCSNGFPIASILSQLQTSSFKHHVDKISRSCSPDDASRRLRTCAKSCGSFTNSNFVERKARRLGRWCHHETIVACQHCRSCIRSSLPSSQCGSCCWRFDSVPEPSSELPNLVSIQLGKECSTTTRPPFHHAVYWSNFRRRQDPHVLCQHSNSWWFHVVGFLWICRRGKYSKAWMPFACRWRTGRVKVDRNNLTNCSCI